MRTEPHPLPTEPCASARLWQPLWITQQRPLLPLPNPPAPTRAAPRPPSQGASASEDHLDLPFSVFPKACHLPASRVRRSRAPLPAHAPAPYPVQWERDWRGPRAPGRSALGAGRLASQRHRHHSRCLLVLNGAASAAWTSVAWQLPLAPAAAAAQRLAPAPAGRGRGCAASSCPFLGVLEPGVGASRSCMSRTLPGSLTLLSCSVSNPGSPWPPLLLSPISRRSDNGPSNIGLQLGSSAAEGHSPISCNHPSTYLIYLTSRRSSFAKRIAQTSSCFK